MALTQTAFRGRNDDGTQVTATWIAPLNTDWYQLPGTTFRVRFVVESSTAATSGWQIFYSHNGGTWTPVTATSTVIQGLNGQINNNRPTTQQISTGSFVAGTTGGADCFYADTTFAAGQQTELENAFTIVAADVADGDTVAVRVQTSGFPPLDAYSATPQITVGAPATEPPATPTGVAVAPGDDTATISWASVAEATGYEVEVEAVAALAVDDARSATTATSPSLAQASTLAVHDARATARATTPLLAQHHGSLDIVSARSASRAEDVSLAQRSALAVGGARSATTATSPLLGQRSVLAVADARADASTSAPLLAVPGTLVVRNARAATRATSPLLAQRHQLVVDAARAASATSRPLLGQGASLLVPAARSTTTASSPLLAQRSVLAVRDARAATRAPAVLIGAEPATGGVRTPTGVQLVDAYGAVLAEVAYGDVEHVAEPVTAQAETQSYVHLIPASGAVLITP